MDIVFDVFVAYLIALKTLKSKTRKKKKKKGVLPSETQPRPFPGPARVLH